MKRGGGLEVEDIIFHLMWSNMSNYAIILLYYYVKEGNALKS